MQPRTHERVHLDHNTTCSEQHTWLQPNSSGACSSTLLHIHRHRLALHLPHPLLHHHPHHPHRLLDAQHATTNVYSTCQQSMDSLQTEQTTLYCHLSHSLMRIELLSLCLMTCGVVGVAHHHHQHHHCHHHHHHQHTHMSTCTLMAPMTAAP